MAYHRVVIVSVIMAACCVVWQPARAELVVLCRPAAVDSDAVQSEKLAISALDDPHNPFRHEYALWDKWVYAHATDCADARVAGYFNGAGNRGQMLLQAYVDQAGNLVPLKLAEERRLHTYAAGDNTRIYDASWAYVLNAVGPLDQRVLDAYQAALLVLRAEYALPIPAWLAANPPAWALILPPEAGRHAGEVLAFGALGGDLGYALPPDTERPGAHGEVWLRYSPDGQLLGKSKPGQLWWEFYLPNPERPARDGAAPLVRAFEADGIISVSDLHTGARTQLLNFDGTPIQDVKHPQPRNHNHWRGYTASELKAIYAIQHGETQPQPARTVTPARPPAHVPVLGGQH